MQPYFDPIKKEYENKWAPPLYLSNFKVNSKLNSLWPSSAQFQLSWAELALVLIPPAARPPGRSSGLVVNKQEISSTCFVTFVGILQ